MAETEPIDQQQLALVGQERSNRVEWRPDCGDMCRQTSGGGPAIGAVRQTWSVPWRVSTSSRFMPSGCTALA